MRNMKRILFIVAIIAVLAVAGTALAGGHGWRRNTPRGGPAYRGQGYPGNCCMAQGGRQYGRHGMMNYGGGCGMMMYGGRGADRTCPMWGDPRAGRGEVPQEFRDKMNEMRQTMLDLGKEWGNKPIDREKVLELHAKRFSLMQELSEWCLNHRLDALEGESE